MPRTQEPFNEGKNRLSPWSALHGFFPAFINSSVQQSIKPLPVKRSPVPTLTLRTYVLRMTCFVLDFYRCDEFRFAFFAFVEVHHFTIKERLRLKKPFFIHK
jgi:hypothetical protein